MRKNSKGNVIICGPGTLGLERIFGDYGYAAYVYGKDDITGISFDFMALPGGADINPKLYAQLPHKTTRFYNEIDARELAFYWKHKHLKKLGVCRGAQLINVLNGGTLWQNVNNHNDNNHAVSDIKGRKITVCSVHHQMMRPSPKGQVIAWTRMATLKEDDAVSKYYAVPEEDPEVILYPEDQALLFQAHPEFGPKSCTDYFFNLIEEYLS